MFELASVLQPEICSQLEKDITGGTMSPCSLFCGPEYSGKLTAAIEAGKAVSGHGGPGGQGMPANIAFSSARDWQPVVGTALNLFSKQRSTAARRFLVRSVSSMLLSYHPALYSDDLPKARRDAFAAAGEASALLAETATVDMEDESAVSRAVSQLSSRLAPLYKTNPLTVSTVRSIRAWVSSYAVDGSAAVVIIEGLETANEGARNALLKVLEEAPDSCRFILLAKNAERIMETILSRSRRYRFRLPSREAVSSVISGLFMDPKKYPDLREFFLKESGVPLDSIRKSASAFMDVAEGGQIIDARDAITEFIAVNRSEVILRALCDETEQRLLSGKWSRMRAQKCNELLRKAAVGINSYNQTLKAALEALMFALKETADEG